MQDFVTVSSRCAVYAVSDDFSGEHLNNSMIPTAYRRVIEKELNNFIKTVNNLILEDIYTRKSVSVRKVYKDKL